MRYKSKSVSVLHFETSQYPILKRCEQPGKGCYMCGKKI